ncbi:hypothetical protein QTO34_007284 [Cnephaeus nilssonii]|uniref:Uncharacterized protein n=1 Tax=Cnephaeus nilssonii TaxID=3371016 RepID=A0AA40HL18_CNENI|nr:hypothetical protein QTO34_007284 [Eptesicus nilssonii]
MQRVTGKKHLHLKLKETPEPVKTSEDIRLFQQQEILFSDPLNMIGGHSTSAQNAIDHQGAEIVSLRLPSLVKGGHIVFNANLYSHGLKCAASSHHLAVKIKFIGLRIIVDTCFPCSWNVNGTSHSFEPSDTEAFYNIIILCGTYEVGHDIMSGRPWLVELDPPLCSGNETLLSKRELSLLSSISSLQREQKLQISEKQKQVKLKEP